MLALKTNETIYIIKIVLFCATNVDVRIFFTKRKGDSLEKQLVFSTDKNWGHSVAAKKKYNAKQGKARSIFSLADALLTHSLSFPVQCNNLFAVNQVSYLILFPSCLEP